MQEELTEEQQAEVEARIPIDEAADSPTAAIKRRFREVAEQLVRLRDGAKTRHAGRSAALALTEIETASMYAVKAIDQG